MKSYGAVMATCGHQVPCGAFPAKFHLPVMHQIVPSALTYFSDVGLLQGLVSRVRYLKKVQISHCVSFVA